MSFSDKIKDLYDNFIKSFKSEEGGFSARKLTAFTVMVCVVVAHGAWLKRCFMTDNFTYLESVLIIDYSFVTSMLGLTTWSYIKEKQMKDKKNDEKPE